MQNIWWKELKYLCQSALGFVFLSCEIICHLPVFFLNNYQKKKALKNHNLTRGQLIVKYFNICHDCQIWRLKVLVQLLRNLYIVFLKSEKQFEWMNSIKCNSIFFIVGINERCNNEILTRLKILYFRYDFQYFLMLQLYEGN